MDTLLRGANSLTPSTSHRAKREPLSVRQIEILAERLDLSTPLDAAVFACITTTFWATARLGEMTTSRINDFNPQVHVKRSDIRMVQDRNGLTQTEIFIPRTKSAPEGEAVSWAPQTGPSNPEAALNNHFLVNDPPVHAHLFSYHHLNGFRSLTKSAFSKRVKQATSGLDSFPQQGHSIRIGSTLEYLLRGIPFDVVKVKGRWASDAFLLYLRRHAQILAPYMQATPLIHDSFIRYTMPPIR
jgi:hypothetical protein